ncbi:MAG: hypothetical protein JKP92_07585 [Alphaproteobacteria bacterium]|nr:hypothetical protein [Alphaproteobacteria bacterium]
MSTFEEVQESLMPAILGGDLRGVQRALGAGAIPSEYHMIRAVESGIPAMADAVQKAGLFDLATIRDESNSPVALAVGTSGEPVMVDWAIDQGVLMDVEDERGNTPAHDLMIDIGSSVGIEGADARGADMLLRLRELGVDLNQPNADGERPIETLQSVARMDITGDPEATLADLFPDIVAYMDSIGAGLDDGPVEVAEEEAAPAPEQTWKARATEGGWEISEGGLVCWVNEKGEPDGGFTNVGTLVLHEAHDPAAVSDAARAMGLGTDYYGCNNALAGGVPTLAVPLEIFQELSPDDLKAGERVLSADFVQVAAAGAEASHPPGDPPDPSPAPGVRPQQQ